MTIPEDITINYIAPNGEVTDITRDVLYSDAFFESQAAAVAGSFHITVVDRFRTHSFAAGGRIEMLLGTQRRCTAGSSRPRSGTSSSRPSTPTSR
jgi:hypothetical protein